MTVNHYVAGPSPARGANRSIAQFGSALALGARCRRFKSCYSDHIYIMKNKKTYPRKNKSQIYSYTEEEFISIIKNNYTYTDCLKEMGLCTTGSCSRIILKKRIKELNIDISHFDPYLYAKSKRDKKIYTEEEKNKILSKNSVVYSSTLRRIIMNNNLLEEKCAICGISNIWNNKTLTLQLDHINGDHNDNRLENLRFLCPNCHSQTETYSGRNINHKKRYDNCKICGKKFLVKSKKQKFCSQECFKISSRKIERPTYKNFLQEFEELKHNYCAMARKYGVTDNTIRKWERAYKKEKR